MKKLIMMLFALTVNMFMGGTLATAIGVSPVIGGIALNAVAMAMPLMPGIHAGLYAEVWTGEIIKAFRNSLESIGWISRIRDYSQYAEKNVIHFVDLGGDPTVLVNNTTYPLGIENLADADKPIGLDKYQTKPTRITDDELHAISYDKMGSVVERHREAIDQKKFARAISAIAPANDGTLTPVVVTSGSVDAGRKRLKKEDIVSLKKSFDTQKIPVQGRILVLCPDHVNDLLLDDQKFAGQYYNYTSGKIANLYGFEVYEYVDCPYYNTTTKAKLAYGAVPTTTDTQASVAFYAPRMFRATGTTKTYLSEAKTNPTTQENLINFRHYFIALPMKEEAIGAIISAKG